jgi:hypothetical protein
MTKEELENYVPKGELEGFPKEVIKRILDYQEEQLNKRDVSVFEKNRESTMYNGGFDWNLSKEGQDFWHEVISNKNFDIFFEKYPKKDNQDNLQEFKVGDKVIDIIRGRIGKVIGINTLNKDDSIFVVFDEYDTASFTLDGRYYSIDKYPRLLHYRDDYDYLVINFNNLPERQEANRWRAEVGETYYSFTSNFKVEDYYKENDFFDEEAYDSNNYFQTKEEAQEVADKLKEYFNQLINK